MAPSADPELWNGRPVLVTGATGFLGSHLTGLLVAAGAEVAVLRRDHVPSSSIERAWADRVTWVAGEVEDQRLLERALGEHRVATVFHLAAQTQVGVANANPVSTFDANVRGTWSLLEAVRRSPRVSEVVVASSDKAYGAQPVLPYTEDMPLAAVHPYDVSKACADLITVSYHSTWGVPAAITRCGNFFGPGDRNWDRLVPGTIRSLLRGEPPVVRSDGTLVRDYLYVVDGALAYLRLAEAMRTDPSLAGTAFNFSTDTPLTVLELVERIQTACGTALEPEVLGGGVHEIPAQHLSSARAREVLGWAPTRTVDEALAETVEWYRAELDLPAR
jgi:CDP-glucose 4,6-dehydratase